MADFLSPKIFWIIGPIRGILISHKKGMVMAGRPIKLFTLCFVLDGTRILLGMKKRGFGAGKWNGFGGKVDLGETVEEAARRELTEEVGIIAQDISKRAQFDFMSENVDSDPRILRVSVYLVSGYTGSPEETEEMRPQWFEYGEVPYSDMWPDDEYWLPRFILGEELVGTFWFDDLDASDAKMLRHEIKVIKVVEKGDERQ